MMPGRGSDAQRQAKKNALLEALRRGHTRKAAVQLAGVHVDTLHEWCKKDPKFSEQVLISEAQAEDYCLGVVMSAAKVDALNARWWLERRRPDDYARKETQQVYLQVGRELAQLSDEQLLALATGGSIVPNGGGEVIDVEATVSQEGTQGEG